MKILLLAAAIVLANGKDPPPAAVEDNALVQCSSPEREGHLESLLEEVKGMMQEEVIPLLKTLLSLHNTATQDNSPPCHCKDSLDSVDSTSSLPEVFSSTDQPQYNTTQDSSPPRHCKDLLDSGDSGKGLRDVFPDPEQPEHSVKVYCDHIIDRGGWTVFQRRTKNSTRHSFERSWNDYKEGFGDKSGEHWLGLDVLHQLTSGSDQELRIDLHDYEGEYRWAMYGLFHVDSEDTNYRLTVERYSGDAGDAMINNNGQEFSTRDADHDTSSGNCAELYRGGWWFDGCGYSNLNGYPHEGKYRAEYSEGLKWQQWRGYYYSLRRTTMMIRPAP